MSQIRPAGLSDESGWSDDDFDFNGPRRQYQPPPQNNRKIIENALLEAIFKDNATEVERIIINEYNRNFNVQLESGWTPLMHAVNHAADQTVQMLVNKGASPTFHTEYLTPLLAICLNTSADDDTIDRIVDYLLEKDCLLDLGDKYGQTPLMHAISSGRVELVKKLLDKGARIEMRDTHGWTAVFWAVHHNQPEILEILINRGARLLEVDNNNRKIMEIATSHDHKNTIEILKKYIKEEKDVNTAYFERTITSWHDFYPGVTSRGKPSYASEIPYLLYGMSCETLDKIMKEHDLDLRTFLLLNEQEMIKLGIELPFQRQRLLMGLRNFHRRAWKLKVVPGLTAMRAANFTTVDGLTALGSHLQQIYVLEATLQYAIREYYKCSKEQSKAKPPDSVFQAATQMQAVIRKGKKQLKQMRETLTKISRNNPVPADMLKDKSVHEIAMNYLTEAFIVCSLGVLVYQAKNYIINMLPK